MYLLLRPERLLPYFGPILLIYSDYWRILDNSFYGNAFMRLESYVLLYFYVI
jgi:hypothetical protein